MRRAKNIVIALGASLVFLSPGLALAADAIDMGGSCPPGSSYSDMVAGGEGGAAGQYATNPGSTATGTYQFTFGTLQDLGYISSSSPKPTSFGESDWDNVIWTNKDGVSSRRGFMDSQSAQDNALNELTSRNLQTVSGSWSPDQSVDGVQLTDGGVAYATHMLGAGGFEQWAASGFSPSGLDASIAAAHGWTPEEYQRHLVERLAEGSCTDPGDISTDNPENLPPVYLMDWKAYVSA